jgi:hypothetical protein
MSLKRILRRVVLGLLLGGRLLFGISISSEKIEELLFSMNQPRAEESYFGRGTRHRRFGVESAHEIYVNPRCNSGRCVSDR